MIELSDVRNTLETTASKLADFRGLFDLENKEARIQELDEMMLMPDFGMTKTRHKQSSMKQTV